MWSATVRVSRRLDSTQLTSPPTNTTMTNNSNWARITMRNLILGLSLCACGLLCPACALETGSAPSTPATSTGPLPNRLTPGHLRRGVRAIMGYARGCGFRYRVPGKYRIRVVVSGATGRPISVTVINRPPHRPTELCVINALKRARFQRFRTRTQSFIYPIIFR